jgi:Caspase domain/WD domain, G-beta repeat
MNCAAEIESQLQATARRRNPHSLGYSVILVVILAVAPFCGTPAFGQGSISDIITDSVTRNVTNNIGRNLEANLIKPTLSVKRAAGAVRGQSVSTGGRYLSLLLADGTVRVWDLELGIQRPSFKPQGQAQIAVPSPDGRTVAVVTDGVAALYDLGTRRALGDLSGQKGAVLAVAFTPDGKLIATGSRDGSMTLWTVDKRAVKQTQQAHAGGVRSLAVKPDGALIATGGADRVVKIWDAKKGKVVGDIGGLDGEVSYVQFAPDGKRLFAGTTGGTLAGIDLATRKVTATIHSPAKTLDMAVNSSGVAAFGGSDGKIAVVEFASGSEIKTMPAHSGAVRFLAFGGKAQRLISSGDDGAVRLWDTASGERLAEVITTAGGWAVIDRQGRFDGSEQGMNDVGWHARDQEIPLDSLAEQFFEPGLLARYLDEKLSFGTKVPGNVTEGIAIPPKVEIDLPDASRAAGKPFTVLVVVTDQGGGIDQVRLYHNGKLVQPGSLLQQREVEAKGQRIRVVAFQVRPISGINTFRGAATGLWGIEGESKRTTETFVGDGPLPKLHVMAVGINKYSDPKLTLGYSVPDAKAIVDQMQRAARGAFSAVEVHALYDNQATRANIIGTLKGLSGVDENDVVVVYLAGHGIVVGDDWIFLPHEARMQKKFEDYRKGAITSREIQDALVAAQAQRVLVMIDSCQSGATVETFERQQNFERRYMRNFSRVAGVTVIAASRRDQEAIELPSLGHGLFTYVVLKGLDGEADGAPRDGNVTAHEIVQYADLQIPGMSKRYLNEPQVPMAFALGADFSLRVK